MRSSIHSKQRPCSHVDNSTRPAAKGQRWRNKKPAGRPCPRFQRTTRPPPPTGWRPTMKPSRVATIRRPRCPGRTAARVRPPAAFARRRSERGRCSRRAALLTLPAVCCTFFAALGSLFLFLIAGLMRSNYRYIHIEGDLSTMHDSVSYAGAFAAGPRGPAAGCPRAPPCHAQCAPFHFLSSPPPLSLLRSHRPPRAPDRSLFLPGHCARVHVLLGKGQRQAERVGGGGDGNSGADPRWREGRGGEGMSGRAKAAAVVVNCCFSFFVRPSRAARAQGSARWCASRWQC